MSSLAHGMKKRISKVTTRAKTIEANISADYTAAKSGLLREKAAVAAALKSIEEGKAAWLEVYKTQKRFSEAVLTEVPVDAEFYADANETAIAMREMQTTMASSMPADSPYAKLVAKAKAYLAEIESIEKEFKDVETSYTEVARYEKKVGKLTEKGKKEDKTKRNLDKLTEVRSVHKSKTDGIIEKMTKTTAKYEGITKCLVCAFWLEQSRFAGAVGKGMATVSEKADKEKDALVALDLDSVAAAAAVASVPAVPTEKPAEPVAPPAKEGEEIQKEAPVPAS